MCCLHAAAAHACRTEVKDCPFSSLQRGLQQVPQLMIVAWHSLSRARLTGSLLPCSSKSTSPSSFATQSIGSSCCPRKSRSWATPATTSTPRCARTTATVCSTTSGMATAGTWCPQVVAQSHGLQKHACFAAWCRLLAPGMAPACPRRMPSRLHPICTVALGCHDPQQGACRRWSLSAMAAMPATHAAWCPTPQRRPCVGRLRPLGLHAALQAAAVSTVQVPPVC